MNLTAECAAVIPCLNEAAAIQRVVIDVRQHLDNVIVVDDGSSDATGALAQKAGAEVLRHDKPCGKGAALEDGWRFAHQRGFLWALTMDGDGQHSANDIPTFVNCAQRIAPDLIVGNRMDDPRNMPWLRRFVNRWMSARISGATGISMPDTQSGFRLMNLAAWAACPPMAAHFEIESEVLLAFAAAKRRIEFVPIQVIYQDERSKINPLRDTIRWFRWWRHARRRYARERLKAKG